jgi:hypothetical protein
MPRKRPKSRFIEKLTLAKAHSLQVLQATKDIYKP